MKKLSNVLLLISVFIFVTSCGVQTAPLSNEESNENTIVQDTSSEGFSTITKTVPTTGSFYYSFLC